MVDSAIAGLLAKRISDIYIQKLVLPKQGTSTMKVRIFRQRVSQVHESEVEINEWLAEMDGKIEVSHVTQSSYMTDNTDNAQPGLIVSVWYNES